MRRSVLDSSTAHLNLSPTSLGLYALYHAVTAHSSARHFRRNIRTAVMNETTVWNAATKMSLT